MYVTTLIGKLLSKVNFYLHLLIPQPLVEHPLVKGVPLVVSPLQARG